VIGLLAAAAASSATNTAVITSEGSACYGELLADARRVASALRRRGVTRFAVVEHDAGWVLRLLAGAALAGAEPCQYRPDIAAHELTAQARALGHAVLVTRRPEIGERLQVIAPGRLTAPDAEELPARCAEQLHDSGAAQPILILTTGTTGAPKAARHDWRRLGHTVARVQPRPDQRWLLAYGPHQFAGIQVLQHVVATRATLIAPYPRGPADGLQALRDHGVTCLSATPTYWRFLLAEACGAGHALPPLERVTLGGEASPGDLLEDLRRAFPGARISHVYASTELGSITSVRDGRPGLPVAALYSRSNPSASLRVIDGELWVRPPAGMLGYADGSGDGGRDSTDTIGAAGGGDRAAQDGWHPTGDLVQIAGDRVLFGGRRSEVINVGGIKVHPLPVENRIAALDSVAMARVYGRANPLTGAIVAADVVPVGDAGQDDVRHQIRAALADLPPAWRPRSIRFVKRIETRHGKVTRGTVR
jgi:acyl-CoA synthetase (AMP-forming)/AMP-acid ligase II